MLITKELTIQITNKNVGYYKNKNYQVKSGDTIIVNVNDLPPTSKLLVKVKCSICESEKEINYFSYLRNIKNQNYYSCNLCTMNKCKHTNNDKYGVDYPLQLKEILNKMKKTKLEKYDDEYYLNVEKQKETNIEKYNCDSYMKTNDFRNKSKIKMLELYKVEYALQNKDLLNKYKNTNIDKYGCEFPSQNNIVKKKIKCTKLLIYDDENYNNRDKFKETMLNQK